MVIYHDPCFSIVSLLDLNLFFFFFFFSSRRRHTRCSRDWSSDVCSSDLGPGFSIARKKRLRRAPRRRAPSPVAAGKRLSASENHSPRARPEPPPDRLRCLPSTFRLHRSAATVE